MVTRVVGMPTLQVGDEGPLVELWMFLLVMLYGYKEKDFADGPRFLNSMVEKTVAFQVAQGLRVTAQVDDDTWSQALGLVAAMSNKHNVLR